MTHRLLALTIALPLALAACAAPTETGVPGAAEVAVTQRLDFIEDAVA